MTKVKICGLKTAEAVQAAVSAGADYIGFVFAPSKRQISFQAACELGKLIPDSVQKVGVFVSPTQPEILQAIQAANLDLVQIHGDFDERLLANLPVPSIRAIQVSQELAAVNSAADFVLFDAPVAGSGKTFDWQKLDTTAFRLPFFIAGGLTADNVQDAIARFQPYAVDVSSSVETDGVKDVAKIQAFIEKVKNGI
ncbi:phosphoribosylanthranilate isomerase [Kingella negevensis]|uniref:N-(5'-phosphoribosyl)anthranilate isomerase n=1 Tax=Kingella negevensis TaxID=1522312 RepID=A0A238HDS2_9NEIS|nr:phosphoribosylanthranilate isomerase [Kingella negevensis]MDK4684679.1 phosphoribosylanthranilate isomerase [Kingella negevensis]MDK4696585.1 phosphoribosylanthranilate isomerase [Kingella negevensis]MDK4707390.1 phosphoribosylanthranilate isomerase [Kingella negevensis]MDK4710133.1 phosphoribosylanthranilate isomerase [Kingella negevensis]WII92556.1 phosphoribosylanthranilate isomerase [Kingella negevensis]